MEYLEISFFPILFLYRCAFAVLLLTCLRLCPFFWLYLLGRILSVSTSSWRIGLILLLDIIFLCIYLQLCFLQGLSTVLYHLDKDNTELTIYCYVLVYIYLQAYNPGYARVD